MDIAVSFKEINLENVKKDMYCISENGEIYSMYAKKILKPKYDKYGYLELSLSTQNGKRKSWKVHQLVARVYLGSPPSYMVDPTVDHINGIKTDNHYLNLRWMERSVNSSIRKKKGIGENNPEAKLSEKEVIEICELLIQKDKTLSEIANIYNVEKSTISNIKRKKNWKHLTQKYSFKTHKQKNKEESKKQREEIFDLLKEGLKSSQIINMGYTSSVVYRCKRLLEKDNFKNAS